MKQITTLILALFLLNSSLIAQQAEPTKKKLYNPEADAKADLAEALKKAEQEGKHVLVQVGGNWCSWCLLFEKEVKANDTLSTALEKNYVVYHLNHSKEQKNADILANIGYPQRFGFPVFVILDAKGNRLHTQNSVYLEEGKGYGKDKVLEFFQHWSPAAVDAKTYEGK